MTNYLEAVKAIDHDTCEGCLGDIDGVCILDIQVIVDSLDLLDCRIEEDNIIYKMVVDFND